MGNNDLIIITICAIAFVQFDLDEMFGEEWEALNTQLEVLVDQGNTKDLIELYNYIECLDGADSNVATVAKCFTFDLGDYLVDKRQVRYTFENEFIC